MYRWMRDTHLLLGLFSLLFLLVYAVSSVQMAHNRWFNLKPSATESRFSIRPENASNARAIARELMDLHGLRGELSLVRQTETGYSFRIARPGTIYEVDFLRTAGVAGVRANVATFMGVLNRIHHLGGLWHEYPLLNVWGLLVGVVSMALILLALTGIYLWFKLHQERFIGGVLLGISLGYSATLLILMRIA